MPKSELVGRRDRTSSERAFLDGKILPRRFRVVPAVISSNIGSREFSVSERSFKISS